MTIPKTGPIALSVIGKEFSQSAPYNIAKVRGKLEQQKPELRGKPISFSNFRNVKDTVFITLGTQNNVNLRAKLNAIGQAHVKNVHITVASNALIGSASNAVPAIRSGGLISGSTVTIVVNGGARIYGKGGNGGNGGGGGAGGGGQRGGDAILIENVGTYLLYNSGTIAGGGGGGGGGGGFKKCTTTTKSGCTAWGQYSGYGGRGGAGHAAGSTGSGGQSGGGGAGAGGGLGAVGRNGGGATWGGGGGGGAGRSLVKSSASGVSFIIKKAGSLIGPRAGV